MANEIRTKFDAAANFTITLASLAAGAGRQSNMVANASLRPAALVYLRLPSGAVAPAAGNIYEVYLLRGDGVTSYRTDGAGASDAAITIENAPLLGTIVVTNTASKNFYGDFDTAALGPLGPSWGIAIVNATNQAMNATEGNFIKEYATYLPEVQ